MVLASIPKQSPQPHVKKRHGQHHRTSKNYSKTYWPYLPMLLIVGLGFVLNNLWSYSGSVLSYNTSLTSTTLLQETNIHRTQHGVQALAHSNLLSKAAQSKADDMAAHNYWSHTSPDGKQPWQFISSTGYGYTLAGENLAYGFAQGSDVVAGWMNSNGHRDNLLKTDYKEVGFGIAHAKNFQGKDNQAIVVALYAEPSISAGNIPTQADDLSITGITNTNSDASKPDQTSLIAKPVSRFEVLMADSGRWLLLVVTSTAALAAIVFAYRHGKMWRRYLIKGERYLMKHPLYDISLLAAVVVSIVLSQTSGFIH